MDFREYFQEELAYLQALAHEFAADEPALEPFLSPQAGESEVQRLFEAFAFLSARVRQKIDDVFPEITHPLLERIFPLPLRPLPSAAVIQFASSSNEVVMINQGAQLFSQSADNKKITLTTTKEVTVSPLTINKLETMHAPDSSSILLMCQYGGHSLVKDFVPNTKLCFFLGEDAVIAAQLQLWFSCYLEKVTVIVGQQMYSVRSLCEPNVVFKQNRLTPVLPVKLPQYRPLQLVAECISLPYVHHFLTLDFTDEYPVIPCDEKGRYQLCFKFNHPLENVPLTLENFRLNCVPVLNLYAKNSKPRQFIGKRFPVQLAKNELLYQLSDVVSKQQEELDNQQTSSTAYLPISEYLPMHHIDPSSAIYYQLIAQQGIINEVNTEMRFLSAKGDVLNMNSDEYFSYQMLCVQQLTDGEITPSSNIFGEEAIPNHLSIQAVTTGTGSKNANLDATYHWSLISDFSLSSAFLADVTVIKALLCDLNIYDQQNYVLHQRWLAQIDGLTQSEMQLTDFAYQGMMKRGAKITLFLNENHFDSEGMLYRFGALIAELLPYCFAQSAFLQVKIVNTRTKNEWSLSPAFGLRPDI